MKTALRRAAATFTLFATIALSTGCLTPYIKRQGATPDPRPAKAITAGYVVKSGSSERSIIDAVQDTGLSQFGNDAVAPITEALRGLGYETRFDKIRASALNTVSMGSDSATTALTGQFIHPESSYWHPEIIRGPFLDPRDLVVKVKGDDANEYVAFVGVTIYNAGNFFKEPLLDLRITVFDQAGKRTLEVRGVGRGSSSLFIVDRSPQNLTRALEEAIASLKTVTEEPLAG